MITSATTTVTAPTKGWDDSKIELLGDEDATKVKDRNTEALSHKRARIDYIVLTARRLVISTSHSQTY